MTTIDEESPAADDASSNVRPQDHWFAAACVVGEVIKAELIEDHQNTILFGDPARIAWLFDNQGLPLLETLRALHDGHLEPDVLIASERETALKFKNYCQRIQAFAFEKGYTAEQIDKARRRTERAQDVVRRLEGGERVLEAEVAEVLDTNAVGKIEPIGGRPSERVFYDPSLQLENRLILDVELKGLSEDLARACAVKQLEVVDHGPKAVTRANLSAEDPVVRFRQNLLGRLDDFHQRQVEAAVSDAAQGDDGRLVGELIAERERRLLYLVGRDRITISLHAGLAGRLGEFAAELANPEVANGRVVVMRTGAGRQDGDPRAIGSLRHAMETDSGQVTLRGCEARLRDLENRREGADDADRQEVDGQIRSLGLRSLFADVEVHGGEEKLVLKNCWPCAAAAPARSAPDLVEAPIERADLEDLLGRWFAAEELVAADVDRLARAWRVRSRDRMFVDMLRRQFDPANRVALGLAWWEERQQGEPLYEVLPVTRADHIKMWLTIDPLAHPPKPRPWCPDVLAGPWRLAGARNHPRDPWAPPAEPREWMLRPDGRVETVGDARHDGWTWAVHWSGRRLDLMLFPGGTPLPEVRPIFHLDETSMDLFVCDLDPCHLLWRRP